MSGVAVAPAGAFGAAAAPTPAVRCRLAVCAWCRAVLVLTDAARLWFCLVVPAPVLCG